MRDYHQYMYEKQFGSSEKGYSELNEREWEQKIVGKRKKISSKKPTVGFEEFISEYGLDNNNDEAIKSFKAALRWLYKYSKTKKDLCLYINLFWNFARREKKTMPHGQMILEIYDLMKNAENIEHMNLQEKGIIEKV